MIKLTDLLLESINKPKAIFLGGAAGSGKSYISNQLIPSNFTSINVDDDYEELLKKSGIGLNQKDFDSEKKSMASKMLALATKSTREKLFKHAKENKNLVIDGTGAAIKPLLKKKQELEDLGYETYMVMIYVSPLTSLERNKNRERILMPSIVLRTWRDVNKNINEFKNIFNNNFVLVNNEPKGGSNQFSQKSIEPYFDNSIKGKPKTPEEIAKSKADRDQINKDIEQMVQSLPKMDSIETAKSKINQFIK